MTNKIHQIRHGDRSRGEYYVNHFAMGTGPVANVMSTTACRRGFLSLVYADACLYGAIYTALRTPLKDLVISIIMLLEMFIITLRYKLVPIGNACDGRITSQ